MKCVLPTMLQESHISSLIYGISYVSLEKLTNPASTSLKLSFPISRMRALQLTWYLLCLILQRYKITFRILIFVIILSLTSLLLCILGLVVFKIKIFTLILVLGSGKIYSSFLLDALEFLIFFIYLYNYKLDLSHRVTQRQEEISKGRELL